MYDLCARILTISIGLLVLAGCPVKGDPIGETCSPETLCDDLCLLDLPNGMCSKDCSGGGCPSGFVCGELSGGEYCLSECSEDADCRDGMICAVGGCTVPKAFGTRCEEDADCAGRACHEGLCNLDCRGDCPEGLSCVHLAEGPRCVEHTDPGGAFGQSCTFEPCPEGFVCMARTQDPGDDQYAFCSAGCGSDVDCPLSMICRETQQIGEAEPVARCVLRDFCERCSFDAECGTGEYLCVSEDPARGSSSYCSEACDPEVPSTCPADSTCREALYCAADRSWVADCAWCSDEASCASREGGAIHQCFHDYGACRGTGVDYCSPCVVNSDCPEGGFCGFNRYAQNRFCTMPCETPESCMAGPGHDCVLVSALGYRVCVPRSGSCSVPSGGLTTCFYCQDSWDCLSGICLPQDPANPGSTSVCWEDCEFHDCPDYTVCFRGLTVYGENLSLCSHPAVFGPPGEGYTGPVNCAEVQICTQECPDGPTGCVTDRDYCR